MFPAANSAAVTTSGIQLGDLYIGYAPAAMNASIADAINGPTMIGTDFMIGGGPSATSITGGSADSIMTIGGGPSATSVTGGTSDSIMTVAEGPSAMSVTGGTSDSIMTVAGGPSAMSVTGGGADSIMTVAEGPSAMSVTGGGADSIMTVAEGPSATSITGGAAGSILNGVVIGSGADTVVSPYATGVDGGGGVSPGLTMTSLSEGGSIADAALVENALTLLGTSTDGADEVDRLRRAGARIDVLSAADFAARGQSDAHAFFDRNTNVLYMRREDLQSDSKLAAIEIAHEGTHLLDHAGKVNDVFTQPRLATISTLSAAQASEALRQLQFEDMMVSESRAFLYAGQVARDLGWTGPVSDPTTVAEAGGNDAATYAKVWQQLQSSVYNTEHRAADVVTV